MKLCYVSLLRVPSTCSCQGSLWSSFPLFLLHVSTTRPSISSFPLFPYCALPKHAPNRFLLPVPVASHCSISLPHLSVRCPSPVPIVCPFLGPYHEWMFPWGYPCRILDAPLPHSVLVAYTYPLTRIIAETYLHVLVLWSSKKPLRWNCLSFGLYYWSLWMTIKTKKTKKYSWNQKQVTSTDFSKTFMYKKN